MSETEFVEASVVKRRGFRTDIQGLRAVAVGLVLVYHAGIPFVPGGYVGVDVFFVISGFLISSHLLESIERDGRVRFGDFYARRIRRILPASLTVAILTMLAAIVFVPPLALERVLRDALATVLYVPNIWFAIQNTDYLADHSPSPYQHYWSLGVEEQFYLLWPVVLLGLFLLVRRRSAAVVGGIAVLTVLSFAYGAILTPLNAPAAFFLLPSRAWELLIGAIVGAMILHDPLRIRPWIAGVGGWLGFALVLASALFYNESTAFPGAAALLPAAGTALLILFGATASDLGPTRLLSLRPIQFVGMISYSLYLVHWPLLVITQQAVGEQNPLPLLAKIGLGIVLALPLAWFLFRLVETPLRSARALTRRRPAFTLYVTIGITIVLVAVLLAATAWAGSRSVGSGAAVPAAPESPVAPPSATPFVPENMTPALDAVADDLPPMYADGCHYDVDREDVQKCRYGASDAEVTIALFGDSHSAQWFPALAAIAATDDSIGIDTYTKSSCPAVSTTVIDKKSPYLSCDRWRASVLSELIANPPDIAVISNYSAYMLPGGLSGSSRVDAWAAGTEETVKRLREAGIKVLVIADTPRFDAAPSVCASAHPLHVAECAGARSQVLNTDMTAAESRAVETAGGVFADLTRFICDPRACPVIIGDMFVYRDANHLTATFTEYLAPVVEKYLVALIDR